MVLLMEPGGEGQATELRTALEGVREALAEGNGAEAEVRAMAIAHALLPEQANPDVAEANEVRLGVLILALAEGTAGSPDQVARTLIAIAGESWAAGVHEALAEE